MKTVQDLLDENNRELIKIDPNQTVFEALPCYLSMILVHWL